MGKAPVEDPLVAQAFDASKHDALEQAIKELTPDEAEFFLWKLEIALRKRKVQLLGYLVAMFVWLIGMVGALVIYGMSSGFVGWVFIAPFAIVGVILYGFGWWANKLGRLPRPVRAAADPDAATSQPPAITGEQP